MAVTVCYFLLNNDCLPELHDAGSEVDFHDVVHFSGLVRRGLRCFFILQYCRYDGARPDNWCVSGAAFAASPALVNAVLLLCPCGPCFSDNNIYAGLVPSWSRVTQPENFCPDSHNHAVMA